MTIIQKPIKSHHKLATKPLASKRDSILGFINFILWVGIIGLLLLLVTCEQVQPIILANDDSSDGHISSSKIISNYINNHSKNLLGAIHHG